MFGISCTLGVFLASVVVTGIWWTERKIKKEEKIARILTSQVIHGKQTPQKSTNRQLILVTGEIIPTDNLSDDHLKSGPWLKLQRKTEYFSRNKKRGKKNRIESEGFRVKNARLAGYHSRTLLKYILGLNYLKPLPLSPEMLKDPEGIIKNGMLYIPDQEETDRWEKRISYSIIAQGPYSVIGRQIGKKLMPFSVVKGEPKKYYFAPGVKTSGDLASLVNREGGFYHFVFRMYIFGFMWLAFCLILYPFHGNFRSWSFLNKWTRILPLIFSVPTCFFFIMLNQKLSSPKSLPFQFAALALGTIWFISVNRSIKVESREESHTRR